MSISAALASAYSSSQRLTLGQLLFFPLVPGVMITLAYIALAWLTTPLDWSPSLARLLIWLIVGIAVLIGFLFYYGRTVKGDASIDSLLLYRQSLPWRHCAWLVVVLLVWSALASTLLFPLVNPFGRISGFLARVAQPVDPGTGPQQAGQAGRWMSYGPTSHSENVLCPPKNQNA